MSSPAILRRTLLGLAVLVILVAAGGWGILRWMEHRAGRADDRLFQQVSAELLAGRSGAALDLIDRRVPGRREAPWRIRRWLDVEIEAATVAGGLSRLDALQQRVPAVFQDHEEACLLLARAGLHTGQGDRLDDLATAWRDRTTNAHRWFALQVDRWLLAGHRDEACAALSATNFAGANDVPRLTRLALVTAPTNLLASWELLDQAHHLSPRSPDVRLFRAQILEGIRKPQRARVEYVAAWLADPTNPWLADQLAEFYRRRGNHAAAVEVWAQSLTNNPVDFIALKWAFWRRVTAGDTSVPDLDDLAGTLAPLVHRILALPADRFWDDEVAMFPGVTDRLLRSRQEVFWLRLLEALRRQEFPEALDLLRHHPFTLHSWAPELERALLRLLALRQLDTLNPVGLPPFPPDRSLTNLHSFFARLESAASAETPATEGAPRARTFWDRPQAVALTWVAAGWLRAGLHLVPDPVHPGEFEPADAYTWAQALRYSEGPEPALAFLQARPAGSVRSPELTLLQGELLLALGRLEEAVALLEPLAAGEFTAGIHAAWLLGTLAVDQSQPARAAAVLDANPAFAASVPGRELAARVALLNQDTNTARTLYTELATDSIEGRMFRAREAFAQADWASARQLIEDLLVDVPDSIQLRSDLETIRQAEAGTAP